MNKVLQDSEGRLEYKHENGVITQVLIEVAGLGTQKVRVTSFTYVHACPSTEK